MPTDLHSLSDAELRARLLQRGCEPSLAHTLVDKRDEERASAVICALLGEGE